MDFDQHFRRSDLKRYALQCGMAGLVVLLLLLVFDAVTQTVLIASLGASAFIAFAVPRSLLSGHRHMIGGYLVGIIAGVLMVVTRTEHPPAAALALGLVLNEWTFVTLLVVLAGVIVLSVVKRLILPMLLDLI